MPPARAWGRYNAAMRNILSLRVPATVGVVALAAVGVVAQTPAPPATIAVSATAPKGAIVLLDKNGSSLSSNWLKRHSQDPAGWTFGTDGVITPNRTDIVSKQSFGDFFLHVEFKCPTGHGNAGIGLQGRYEVQIYNSAGQKPENTNAGAFYNQKPALLDASKPAGEWQSYDIFFRAPRFNAEGKQTEPARATVLQNGIAIHVNNDFLGPTGIQYEDFKTVAKTGPIVLQGDHDAVQYRNIWVVPF